MLGAAYLLETFPLLSAAPFFHVHAVSSHLVSPVRSLAAPDAIAPLQPPFSLLPLVLSVVVLLLPIKLMTIIKMKLKI